MRCCSERNSARFAGIDELLEHALSSSVRGGRSVDLRNLCSMDHRAARQPSKAILGLLGQRNWRSAHTSPPPRRAADHSAGANPQQVVLKQLAIKLAPASAPPERARRASH